MRLLACLLLTWLPALSSFLGDPGSAWYQGLEKPAGQPPGWVFGPVWSVLFTLHGIALWRGLRGALGPCWLRLWLLHTMLCAAWTPVFFALYRPELSLVVLLALDACALLILRQAWGQGWALRTFVVPSVVWLGFATYLNLGIVWLNR